MSMRNRIFTSLFSLTAGICIASAVMADTSTYHCQFDQSAEMGLTINYDTSGGQFSLVDFNGSPNLPTGVQVRSFNPNGAVLAFSLDYYQGAAVVKDEEFYFDFSTGVAHYNRIQYAADGGLSESAEFDGTCTVSGGSPAAQEPAAPVTVNADLPAFTGEGVAPEVMAALALSEQNLAVPQPAADVLPRSNTDCVTRPSYIDLYNPNQYSYGDVTYCASTELVSSDFEYGHIEGFVSPNTTFGMNVSWCTGMGGYGNFGQGESVELYYSGIPRGRDIRALVIRSGTGHAADSPYKHSKPRVLRVETEGLTWIWNLESNVDFQAMTFDQALETDWVRVTIEDAYLGDTWSNTCISDLFAVINEKH